MPISSETIRDIPAKPLDSITALEAIREIKTVVEEINDSVKLNNVSASNDVTAYTADGALATTGIALCTSGAGDLNVTLGVPTAGSKVEIILSVDGGGDLIVTGSGGATIDDATTTGNTTATFDTVAEKLVLAYKDATTWVVVENSGVVLA